MTESASASVGRSAARVPTPASRLMSSAAWVMYCVSLVAVALIAEAVPFAGPAGMFAGGGRPALRLFVLCVPIALSAALWAVGIVTGAARIRYTRSLWVLAGLGALILGSTVFAVDTRVAVFGYWLNEQGLVAWVALLALAFLGSQFITSKRRLLQLSGSVVGAAAIVAALALVEVAGLRPFPGYSDSVEWMFQRGSSTMLNPDFLGTFLVLPAVLSVALAFQLRAWRRWAAAGAGVAIWLSMVYSLTRGALIGAVVGLVALAAMRFLFTRRVTDEQMPETSQRPPLWRRASPVAAVAGVLGAGILALGYTTIQERIAQTVTEIASPGFDLSGRFGLWRELVPAVWARPILGSGADNIMFAWQPFADTHTLSKLGVVGYVDSAHNFYLDAAVQFGLVFTIVLVGVVGWLLIAGGRRTADGVASGSTDGWIELGWISAMVATGIAYMTAITVLPIVAYTFAGVGVLLALDVRGTRELTRPTVRWVVAGGTIVASILVASVGLLSGVSAVVGNQNARMPAIRAQRDLTALRFTPWRQYAAHDLLTALQNMTPEERQAVGMTVADGHLRVLAIDSHSAPRVYDYGDYSFMVERNPSKALQYAEKSLVLRPGFAGALMLKGDALNAMNRPAEARPYFERAVDTESRGPEALAWDAPWVSLINFLAIEGKTNSDDAREAEAVLERFKRRFPGSASTADLARAVNGTN